MLPVPGCPTGYTGPGGIHNNSMNWDCIGGAAAYVDKLVLGETHIYKWPTAREIYFPEGGTFAFVIKRQIDCQLSEQIFVYSPRKSDFDK